MEIFKIHINSLYTRYLTDMIKDNYFQTMYTEVIPDVKAWKFSSEDLVLIHVDKAVMSVVDIDMSFWLGYHFCNHLVKNGVNPTHVL